MLIEKEGDKMRKIERQRIKINKDNVRERDRQTDKQKTVKERLQQKELMIHSPDKKCKKVFYKIC